MLDALRGAVRPAVIGYGHAPGISDQDVFHRSTRR
jgi:hypothetical protein